LVRRFGQAGATLALADCVPEVRALVADANIQRAWQLDTELKGIVMTSTLQNKTAAITRAASGIVLATTERLIANGARVVCIDRDEKALAALARPRRKAA